MARAYEQDRNYYLMMENARRESVNRTEQEEQQRRIKAEKKKRRIRAYRIQGAILAVMIMSTTFFTVPKVIDAFTDYTNDSYQAGYQIVREETHRTDDHQHFWFDYYDIADGFQEGMDFDSYVYGVYNYIASSGSGRTLVNMNDFFYQMYNDGHTEYRSFEDYCLAHGFCKEKDGKMVVDTGKYESEVRDYLKSLKTIEQEQSEVQEFRSK